MTESEFPTNEEQRISIYKYQKPTIPSLVTANTSLDELNLNWRERDLPERERTKHVHRLHPYLGKFIPQLVEIFLRKYFKAGQTVYDPFSGSGTTLVEANALGINSIGCDIAAFNCLLARVKTAKYNLKLLREEVLDALAKTADSTQPTLFNAHLEDNSVTDDDNQYLRKWFAPQARKELFFYKSIIPHYCYQDILKVILSRAARSARLTTHFDLDFPKQPQLEPYYCYKHSRVCYPVQQAYKFLQRYSLDTIKRIEEFSKICTDAKVTVLHGDARKISINSKIDGIITSPPYVGLINYHEQHRYAYELLNIVDASKDEIGSASKGNSLIAKNNYQQEIASVFAHSADYLGEGGRAIVIVGDRYNLYGEIAREAGFILEDKLSRHVNRRTGRRSGEFFEEVLIWKKL